MEAKGWMLLQTLLNRYHKGSISPLLCYLPQEEVEKITLYPTESQDVALAAVQPEQLIQQIHYSWLALAFEKLNDLIKPFILASLPATQSEGIQKMLKLSPPTVQVAPPFKNIFIYFFLQQCERSPLPLSFLPASKLTPLLDLTKHQLVELIDFMGLQDLAAEIRHIVDKNKLKKVYLCLSPKKKKFLKICLHHKEKIPADSLTLDRWDGSSAKLENALHRRGLSRLGMALSGQEPGFIKHLILKLDKGRGSILEKNIMEKEIPEVTQAMITQTLNLIKFLYKQEQDPESV